MRKPVIAVPMGDAAGIGPEILVKSFGDPQLHDSRIVVIGDKNIMENACRICGSEVSIRILQDIRDADFQPKVIPLLETEAIDMERFRFGTLSAMCGKAAFSYIQKSIDLAMRHQVDAIATTPINKESLRLAGIDYIGHTEIFAGLTGTKDPQTMFQTGNLRVFFLTRHVSLRQACDLITKDRIVDYVKRSAESLDKLGLGEGKMAIAGLNPHCGEHGLFGDEEGREILPAVKELQEAGYPVEGPVAADSVFYLARQGKYHCVLSLYHDQGHIACKTLDFEKTVSITAGMPILRTSVDHGTAYDIAGRGIASEISMVEAILTAEKYAPQFNA